MPASTRRRRASRSRSALRSSRAARSAPNCRASIGRSAPISPPARRCPPRWRSALALAARTIFSAVWCPTPSWPPRPSRIRWWTRMPPRPRAGASSCPPTWNSLCLPGTAPSRARTLSRPGNACLLLARSGSNQWLRPAGVARPWCRPWMSWPWCWAPCPTAALRTRASSWSTTWSTSKHSAWARCAWAACWRPTTGASGSPATTAAR